MQTLGVYIYFNIHVCLTCIFDVFVLAENSSIFNLKLSFFQLLYFNCISASWPLLCYCLPKVAPLLKWESFLSPDKEQINDLCHRCRLCSAVLERENSIAPPRDLQPIWTTSGFNPPENLLPQSVKTVRQIEKQMFRFVLMPFSVHLRPAYIYKNTSNYC